MPSPTSPQCDGWRERERSLCERFDTVSGVIAAGGCRLDILRPQSVDELISEEDFNRDERLPYWADVWVSALALAERLEGENGHGRRLLELGCGVGYIAGVATLRGFRVTATDYYREACEFTEVNGHRNGIAIPHTRVVDWRDYPEDLRDFDVVVASDVLYEKPYCDLVASCFARSLAVDGLGLLSDPQRTRAAGFPAAAERIGLQVVRQVGMPVEKDGRHQVIDLYELRRLSPGKSA